MRHEVLLQAKRERGLSFRKIAKLSGMSLYSAYTYLTGRARNPTLRKLRRLCAVLGVPMRDVLADEPVDGDPRSLRGCDP